MKTIKVKMSYLKSTKGTHVYSSAGAYTEKSPAIPTLYIKRDAISDKPERITITVEVDESDS